MKIWIAIGVLVIGYTTSTVFVYNNGERMEVNLQTISQAIFPASQKGQLAFITFDG